MLLLYTLKTLVLGPCRFALRVVAMIRTVYFLLQDYILCRLQ